MPQFKIGDLVRLRSGGPLMTIIEVGEGVSGAQVRCQWFSNEKPEAVALPAEALKLET